MSYLNELSDVDSPKSLLIVVRNVFTRCMKHISMIVKERKVQFYKDKRLIYTSTVISTILLRNQDLRHHRVQNHVKISCTVPCNQILRSLKGKNHVKISFPMQPSFEPPQNLKSCQNLFHSALQRNFELP